MSQGASVALVCLHNAVKIFPSPSSMAVLAAGAYINLILVGLELSRAHRYFSAYGDDPRLRRALVALVLAVDVLGSMAACALVFLVVTTGVSGMALHCVLISRLFKLTKSWLLVSAHGIVALLALAGCVSSASLIYIANGEDPSLSRKLDIAINIWLASSTGCDIMIAISLVSILLVAKRSVAPLHAQSQVTGPLAVLIRASMECAVVPATLTIISLGMYHWNATSNIATAIMMSVGRIYTLCLLHTLLLRQRTSRALDTAMTSRAHLPVGSFKIGTIPERGGSDGLTGSGQKRLHRGLDEVDVHAASMTPVRLFLFITEIVAG
ncbi:hypothetical protein RQP46_002227 [Phenoliferia psychrophenolica]